MESIFSQRLRTLREERGLSLQKMGEALETSGVSIGYYERGERVPDVHVLTRMCRYFGVTADYLIGLEDARTHEAADIAARTGLSETAVDVLELLCRQRKAPDFFEVGESPADILSEVIESALPEMTFEKYADCRANRYLHEEHSPEFAEIVRQEYEVYNALSRRCRGGGEDIPGILAKFYGNADFSDAKLLYHRLLGLGVITGDQTEGMMCAQSEDAAALYDICDESAEGVTALPIASLLDEVTLRELGDALRELRAKHKQAKEAPHAEEN